MQATTPQQTDVSTFPLAPIKKTNNMIRIKFLIILTIIATLLFACKKENVDDGLSNIDFRQEMRNFVAEIGNYSRSFDADFIVIPQNGQELATNTGYADGTPQTDYLQSIDATGREDLFYGYTSDNEPTPQAENEYMLGLCQICEQNHVEVNH
jgi:cysteinyl-tRNA synthetase